MKKAKAAFSKQCVDARKRGIEMHFTFEEWCAWWENQLGPDWFKLRGRRKGQYCMARYKDNGPYAAHNVRCKTVEYNHAEYNLYRKVPKGPQRPKLNDKTVTDIYLAKGKYTEIAKQFGVGKYQVHCIKTKKYYTNITSKLGKHKP